MTMLIDGSAGDLRVLAFADYMASETCGGAERVAREVYLHLAAVGAPVEVISAYPRGATRSVAPAGVGVRAIAGADLSPHVGAQLVLAPGVWREAKAAVERFQPNVLHANGLHFQSSVVAAAVARRTDIPLVTTAHLGSVDELGGVVRVVTTAYEQTLGRFVLGSSAGVVAVSGAVAAHVEKLGCPKERVVVVPNGVDLDRFRPVSPGEADDSRTIVFVGRLIANKGPLVLLEALRLLSEQGIDFRAEFLGDGPQGGELAAGVKAAGLEERVELAGSVDDVPRRLARSAIYVRPSFTEGLPLAVLEAMATGVAVVASDVSGNDELVHHERTGLTFPAGDARALAACLRRLLDDPLERRRLGRAGRESVLGHSWAACAAGHADVFVAAQGRRTRRPVAFRPAA